MNLEIFRGILIPFLGTMLGAACVFFMKRSLSSSIQRALTGFAAGIMTAASVWSLLIPAMEQCASMGKLAFLPAAVGFLVGIFFLLGLDHLIPHLHMNSSEAEGPKSKLKKTTMLVLAVTLHNIPEGMAVGVVYAGWASGNMSISAAAALALSVGIAIQNFPCMGLRAEFHQHLRINHIPDRWSCDRLSGIFNGFQGPVQEDGAGGCQDTRRVAERFPAGCRHYNLKPRGNSRNVRTVRILSGRCVGQKFQDISDNSGVGRRLDSLLVFLLLVLQQLEKSL